MKILRICKDFMHAYHFCWNCRNHFALRRISVNFRISTPLQRLIAIEPT
jgi:hypothetical protein